MYKLVQADPRSFYINSPVKIDAYLISNEKTCLVDSGSDKDAGHKVRQVLEREEWSLHIIINIHSNTDHIGGDKYLMQQTGCRIYASSMETASTRRPTLEPVLLCSGYPFKDLRRKLLMVQEGDVNDVSRLSEDQLLKDLELIPPPSHLFQMISIRTPDDIVFLADYLGSRVALGKYRASFIYDMAAYLETLDRMVSMKANLFIPAHAEVSYNVAVLASYNRDRVMEIRELPPELCRVSRTFEILLKEVLDHYGLIMVFQQHVPMGGTMHSYLSWLKDMGEVKIYIEEDRLYQRNQQAAPVSQVLLVSQVGSI